MTRAITILIVAFFSLVTNKALAEQNLVPCNYLFGKSSQAEALNDIFENVVNSKNDVVKKAPKAIFRYAPAFDPEVIYLIYTNNSEYILERIVANDNINGLIQKVANANSLTLSDIPQNVEKLTSLVSSKVSFNITKRNLSTEVANSILNLFNTLLSNSKNPSEKEMRVWSQYLDGPAFFFQTPKGECSFGTPPMEPPAKNILDVVMVIEESFQNSENFSLLKSKIKAITH